MDKGARETMSQLVEVPVTVNSFPMKSIMAHYEIVLDDHEMDQKLMQEIDKQGDKQNRKTNVKADMTDWDMRKKPGFKELLIITDTIVKDIQHHHFSLKIPLYLKDIWGTKYRSNDETIEHSHYPATWSFVYYPNEVEGAPGLTFGEAGIERTIKKGMLLFFHSMLKHSVRKTEFKDFRYCVSGNYETKGAKEYLDTKRNY
tara:strand:- start:58 stop:660 length:603 start_codon:yes stop_codon:yes gene_type:complete